MTSITDIVLRPAGAQDKESIFEWRNTPFLMNLGTSGRPVSWQEHCQWFDKVVGSDQIKIFIIEYIHRPIGQLRFDEVKKGLYQVTIYLIEEFVGRGLGVLSLMRGIESILSVDPQVVFVAVIKEDNQASQNAFAKAGFTAVEHYPDIQIFDKHICMICDSKGNDPYDLKSLISFYDRNVKEHLNDVKSLAWGSRSSQEKRFTVLAKVADLAGYTVLDVGCGLGDLAGWFSDNDIICNYTGYDITPSMIEQAKSKYPGVYFAVNNILVSGDKPGSFDYVVASGTFNRKIKDHEKFLYDMITRMFELSRKAVAFNIMSIRADFMEDSEYYADPDQLEAFCRTLTADVAVDHSYMTHDFTVYMYKGRKQ